MASINHVIFMGNLTRDPVLREVGKNNSKVCRLTIAINDRRKTHDGNIVNTPVFIDVDAWDKLAELCAKHLTKSRTVLVDGRLQMDSWEKDGVKHNRIKVRASTIKFIPKGSGVEASDAEKVESATADEQDAE